MSDDTGSTGPTSVDAFALSDGGVTLVVADFDDTSAAWDAYKALADLEDGRHVQIESVVVVKRDADGTIAVQKASDDSTVRGLGWGVAGGILLGVIFPPSIIGSAIVGAAAGAGAGKLVERHHKKELAAELAEVIDPGHSGIVVLVTDPAVLKVREAVAKANRVVESAVDKAVADDVKAAAKESTS